MSPSYASNEMDNNQRPLVITFENKLTTMVELYWVDQHGSDRFEARFGVDGGCCDPTVQNINTAPDALWRIREAGAWDTVFYEVSFTESGPFDIVECEQDPTSESVDTALYKSELSIRGKVLVMRDCESGIGAPPVDCENVHDRYVSQSVDVQVDSSKRGVVQRVRISPALLVHRDDWIVFTNDGANENIQVRAFCRRPTMQMRSSHMSTCCRWPTSTSRKGRTFHT